MKVKILGIILSVLGIAGLILALLYISAPVSSNHFNLLFAGGIAGTIIFFTGIRLIPNSSAPPA